MRHATVAATAAALLLLSVGPAAAGGTEDPPPYTITSDGLTLPDGVTFRESDDVNVEFTVDGHPMPKVNVHIESQNDDPDAWLIGESFLPWSYVLPSATEVCVTWVQVHDYNEHFGSGEQKPVCTTDAPAPTPSPTTATPAPVESERPDDRTPPEDASDIPGESGDVTDVPEGPAVDDEQPTSGADDAAPAPADATSRDADESAVVGAPVERAVVAQDAVEAGAPAVGAVTSSAPADELPRTGAAVAGLAVAATALLGAGAALLLVRRRRRA